MTTELGSQIPVIQLGDPGLEHLSALGEEVNFSDGQPAVLPGMRDFRQLPEAAAAPVNLTPPENAQETPPPQQQQAPPPQQQPPPESQAPPPVQQAPPEQQTPPADQQAAPPQDAAATEMAGLRREIQDFRNQQVVQQIQTQQAQRQQIIQEEADKRIDQLTSNWVSEAKTKSLPVDEAEVRNYATNLVNQQVSQFNDQESLTGYVQDIQQREQRIQGQEMNNLRFAMAREYSIAPQDLAAFSTREQMDTFGKAQQQLTALQTTHQQMRGPLNTGSVDTAAAEETGRAADKFSTDWLLDRSHGDGQLDDADHAAMGKLIGAV